MAEPGAPAVSPPRRPVYRARVERIRDHNADTRSLFLSLIDGGQLGFVPGQFISISLALENETRVRPYTVASSPEERDAIEICFNQVPGGVGVQYLFARKVGDELQFTGPFGAFTMDRVPEAQCVFIAEGTAIAPIRPMVRRALGAGSHPSVEPALRRARFRASALSRGDRAMEGGRSQLHPSPRAGLRPLRSDDRRDSTSMGRRRLRSQPPLLRLRCRQGRACASRSAARRRLRAPRRPLRAMVRPWSGLLTEFS